MEKRMIYSPWQLEKMIGDQVTTLKSFGCPKEIIAEMNKQKEKIIEQAMLMVFKEGTVPILLVVPFASWDYCSQLNALCQRTKRMIGAEINYEGNKLVEFLFKKPERRHGKFYPIFDIEVGKQFFRHQRPFLSLEEMLAYSFQKGQTPGDEGELLSMNNTFKEKNHVFSLKINKSENIEIKLLSYEAYVGVHNGILTHVKPF